jgi:kynurenine formamidase
MMRTVATSLWASVVIGTVAWTAHSQPAPTRAPATQASTPGATKEQFERWMTELSNWGRWGKDDQLGAANLITAAKRTQALALAKTGTNVSLAHDVTDNNGSDAAHPFALHMIISTDPPMVRDRLDIDYHGGFFTHLDALCHVVYQNKIYNGLDFPGTVQQSGCAQLGITGLKDGVITRGVLIDLPRLKGVSYLEPGTRVYREEIEAWERHAGVRVGPGDALLVRTGRWARRERLGAVGGTAGFDASFLPFLKDRDIALLGSDTAHELPNNIPGLNLTVVHKFTVVARGMNLLDNLDLEAAADTAARLRRWEFMLMVSPIRIPRGTGSPINPLAVF